MKALVIGRFQPLHKGHQYLIEEARNDFEEVIVGTGSIKKSRKMRNPLSFKERKSVIEACYPEIKSFGVKDVGDDQKWMNEVEDGLKELSITEPKEKIVGVGINEWTRRCFRKAGYSLESYELLKPELYSGTEVRSRVIEGLDWKGLVPGCAAERLKILGFERILREKISR